MAQTIVTDGVYFTLNGQQFNRIYVPLRVGIDKIAIYSLFDNRLQLLSPKHYSEFTVNTVGYATQELAMLGLNAALYANPADGLVGGAGTNSLFSIRQDAFIQVSSGATSYTNIGNMSMQNALLNNGEVLHINYGGVVDYNSGAPLLGAQGYSVNLILAPISLAGVGVHDFDVSIDIMRITSTSMKWTAKTIIGNSTATEGGTKTGLDFSVAHAVSLIWQVPPAPDDFQLYFGYVNKLS
tara:strand:- start:3067 stop:3783 length:717 start_codon:yes stop_codon:yes gene_type:complete